MSNSFVNPIVYSLLNDSYRVCIAKEYNIRCFFRTFKIKCVCFVVAILDLVHDVEAKFHLS